MNIVVAFDIDGTLTEDSVMNVYKKLSRNSVKRGIITRRPPLLRNKFLSENNLSYKFARSAIVKSIPMHQIENQVDANKYIYIGNRVSDNMYSNIAGWKFMYASDVESKDSILKDN